MEIIKLIGLISLVGLLFIVSSCADINSGLMEINSSIKNFRNKHDAGDPLPKIKRKLLVYYKYLPRSKKGAACHPTYLKDINEKLMTKIAEVTVTAPVDKRTGKYQDYPPDRLKYHLRMDGCAMGADGFTETEYSEHQVRAAAWVFSENLK